MKEAGLLEPEYKEGKGGFSIYFYKDVYTEENLRKMNLNERQIKAILFVKKNGRITNKDYRNISQLSDEGARIEINKLVRKEILISKGKGRNIHYILK
jgi:ATP-dependent DNA helicase RecG